MIDRKTLEALISKTAKVATVTVHRDEDNYPVQISVSGLKGVGPMPMAPISFSEKVGPLL